MTPLGYVVVPCALVVVLMAWAGVFWLFGAQPVIRAVVNVVLALGVIFAIGGFVNLAAGR